MAEILEFKARPGFVRSTEPVPAEGARILFFLGVRYERIESSAEEPRKRTKGGKPSTPRRPRRRA